MSSDHPVVLFDGVCHLCNGSVAFLYQRDPHGRLRFAHLQSSFGQQILAGFKLPTDEFNSFILLDNDLIYTHSSGALRVLRYLRFPWNWVSILLLVPRPLRDAVYRLVARKRYVWFGREQQCVIPPPGIRARFVEGGLP